MVGCICASYLGNTRMCYGGKASRQWQCDVLSNTLLGNLASCQPYGCHFVMHHLPKHCFRPPSFGLIWNDNAPRHKTKMVQEWFKEHNKEFEVLTDSQILQTAVQLSSCGMYWTNKSDPCTAQICNL